MVELVKQAVEIKMNFENFSGILQSDLECAYAVGYMAKKMGIVIDIKNITLQEAVEVVKKELGSYQPENSQEKNIKRLIELYEIMGTEKKEISELLQMGYEEN